MVVTTLLIPLMMEARIAMESSTVVSVGVIEFPYIILYCIIYFCICKIQDLN